MSKEKTILIIDATYLEKKPNRERNVIIFSTWIQEQFAHLTIVTTQEGMVWYRELFALEFLPYITFVRLPWSSDFVSTGGLSIVREYMKRIVGAYFFLSRCLGKSYTAVYSLTAILPDVCISYILASRLSEMKWSVVFDNFVKKPSEREGRYWLNAIPYLSHLVSLHLLRSADSIFSAMVEKNLLRLRDTFRSSSVEIVPDTNGVDIECLQRVVGTVGAYDIICVGRLHVDKGIFDLLEIIRLVARQRPALQVMLVGWGSPDTEAEVRAFIAKHHLDGQIVWKKHVSKEEKYCLLKSAKIFCFLSHFESYPVAVLEAMACGLPIYAYPLDIFSFPPFTLGMIHTFLNADFEEAAEIITHALEHWQPTAVTESLLSLLDQRSSARRQYAHFL